MQNIPTVKMGLIAVSRDCFVLSLAEKRRKAVALACAQKGIEIYEAETVVESETDVLKALDEVNKKGCNAIVVFLGNFGPETPETLIAQKFKGPVLYTAAAEETSGDLMANRGDAYCGMLNCSYNLGLRKIRAVIPEYPVGTADEVASMIADFIPVARAIIGVNGLKIIAFGPRPQDFFACNAPIKALYDLGVEVQENSELDLLASFKEHANDPRIKDVVKEMEDELGHEGNRYPELLPKMAQLELTLLDWAKNNKGAREYVVFANKCWPAFPKEFGFEPCYVNSRLSTKGIPVACEVDIYGALSEYIGACVTNDAVTLLDINNSVPSDMFTSKIEKYYPYTSKDVFIGFHCGNTPLCKLNENAKISYQMAQNRILENGEEPVITRGTLEGGIAAGNITLFRLHSNADTSLAAYIAQGEVLPVSTCSDGGAGIFAIHEMARFYRHVLIEKRFPHHAAVAFDAAGKALYSVFKYLNVGDISFNQPQGDRYPSENPFA